ncbi:hypothetical protein OBBRIDRAFT_798899 [Obba rivulosa]|uniref:Uncharacterized protein n=1 Tax=Obba rivulosa TaxID=1052685 RepID=A0A8E2AI99_9APHY|nr:hypothetical protein OBBRIDRAFT_798899 [Obba rivulosa]
MIWPSLAGQTTMVSFRCYFEITTDLYVEWPAIFVESKDRPHVKHVLPKFLQALRILKAVCPVKITIPPYVQSKRVHDNSEVVAPETHYHKYAQQAPIYYQQ